MPFTETLHGARDRSGRRQENPVTLINTSKFYEVQKHLTLTRHTYNPQIVVFSKRVWDRLDADEKALIEDAAKEAKAFQRQFSREQEGKALDAVKAAGMQVVELSAAELTRIREKVQPVVKKFSEGVSDATIKELYGEIEKARATR